MALTSIFYKSLGGLAIQLLHVGTILRPMKQSSPALSTPTIGLMPFLAILENVSGYLLHWKNKNKIKMCTPTIPWAHVAFQSDYASIFYHRKYRSPRNTIPEHNLLLYFGHVTKVWALMKISFNVSRPPNNFHSSSEISLAAIMTFCTSRDYRHLFATNMLEKPNNASQ